VSRYFGILEPLPESKPRIKTLAQGLVPAKRVGDFVQAMMDLGATICTPKSPDCQSCPWTEECVGRKQGIAATLPRKAAKKAVPMRKGYAYWIERADGAVLLRRRPEKGLLGGMMEVPSSEWRAVLPKNLEASAPLAAPWRKLPGLVKHTFTHFHLELTVVQVEVRTADMADCRWVARGDLHAEALPTVMRKVVAHVLDQRRPPTSSI